jgi:thioesterase domain-containing protein/acyl carrier protein
MERRIAAIWTRMMKASPSTPHQSFFDAGGDSLMLMRFVHLIEEACGVTLPLADVFAEPSVRALALRVAATIEIATPASRHDRLIEPLVPETSTGPNPRPRFFLVSGLGGHVASFSPAARLIADRWQAVGILDPALFVDEAPVRFVEDLAKRLIAAMRSVASEEPYILAGYSGGARAVMEMARQLRCAGARVGCVVIDAEGGDSGLRAEASRVVRQIRRGGRLAIDRVIDTLTDARTGGPTGLEADRRRNKRVRQIQHGRLLRYRLAASDVPIALIRSEDPIWRHMPRGLHWPRVSQLVGVFCIPGNHLTCFRGENEAAFAGALDAALTAVLAAATRQ